MVAKVLGWRESVKDGKRSFNLYYETDFEDWEGQSPNRVLGTKCEVEWTNRVDCSFLKPGDKIELSYGKGYQGRAVLNDVKVISAAGQSTAKTGSK